MSASKTGSSRPVLPRARQASLVITVGLVGAVRTVARAVAQLHEADAGAVADAQQLAKQALFRIGLRLGRRRRRRRRHRAAVALQRLLRLRLCTSQETMPSFQQQIIKWLQGRTVVGGGAFEFVRAVLAVGVAVAEPRPRDADARLAALEVVVLAFCERDEENNQRQTRQTRPKQEPNRLTGGRAVEFVGIVAAVVGAVADAAQRDARKAVVAKELAVTALCCRRNTKKKLGSDFQCRCGCIRRKKRNPKHEENHRKESEPTNEKRETNDFLHWKNRGKALHESKINASCD